MKKTKNDGAYYVWSMSILLCLVLALFALCFASCAKAPEASGEQTPTPPASSTEPVSPPAQSEEIMPPSQHPSTQPTPPPPTVLGETPDAGQEYLDRFVFLGDSTTYGLQSYGILPATQVWTPTSGTLTLSRWNIDQIRFPDTDTDMFVTEAIAIKKPEYLLVTLGINGVAFLEESVFIENYKNLVVALQEASPDTKIILNSIYPVGVHYDTSTGINNEKITAANGWIERVAEDTGVRFLTSGEALKLPDGTLNEDYNNGDFLHLNPDGYNLILDYVRTHGYK
ncbi:MAG: SGNH/GDSL hydrolase family protein [Oscillospiraceae bacterium]|nr:SGNH/GDSL hydrolase family protein [Oscillospiraceae bacterium]